MHLPNRVRHLQVDHPRPCLDPCCQVTLTEVTVCVLIDFAAQQSAAIVHGVTSPCLVLGRRVETAVHRFLGGVSRLN